MEVQVRVGLKAAIMVRGWTQRQFSRVADTPENRISELIRGWVDPTPAERVRFAELLGTSADVLFSDDVKVEIRSAREMAPLGA